jgi:hypothetical protein
VKNIFKIGLNLLMMMAENIKEECEVEMRKETSYGKSSILTKVKGFQFQQYGMI